MGKWDGWSLWWLAWLVGGFLGPELYSLFTNHPENTLSAQVWRIEHGGGFARYMVFVFTVWMVGHFSFHWWH